MHSTSVFKFLQDVFPEVDVRILKAAAIEHPNDADAAVEFVLFDVLPSIPSPPEAPCNPICNRDEHSSINSPLDTPPTDCQVIEHPSAVVGCRVEAEEQNVLLKQQEAVELESKVHVDTGYTNNAPYFSSTHLDEALAGSLVSNLSSGHDPDRLHLNLGTEELFSSPKHQEINATVGSLQGLYDQSSSMIQEDSVVSRHCSDGLHANIQDLNKPVVTYDSNSSIWDGRPDFVECASETHTGSFVSEREKPESRGSLENISELVIYEPEVPCVEEKSSSTTIVNHSAQICKIDLLEDAIKDAKNNKKTLFSAMESVINMMREVELQEKAAKKSKDEAAQGGLVMLSKAENLRRMIQYAMEANDMHAGDVYGEKSILTTEARELESRLLNLSDERDKSLAILDEMRQTLETRLAAAEEAWRESEQVKLKNEESARRDLAEQELMMEKVVQQSKKLQQEAEENSKLREFLMDRGRVVDILQGEIAVIFQDVKSVKERFDAFIPMSKSLSSSQISYILASSGSSFKGLASNQCPEQVESSTALEKTSPRPNPSPTSSIDGRSQKGSPGVKDITDDHKVILDDDWELFNDEDELDN